VIGSPEKADALETIGTQLGVRRCAFGRARQVVP